MPEDPVHVPFGHAGAWEPVRDKGFVANRDWSRAITHEARRQAAELAVAHTLAGITAAAVAAVPGAMCAGITRAWGRGQITGRASTHAVVGVLADLQTALRQGPGLAVPPGRLAVRIPDMEAERRWPEFSARAAELGVGSLLSLPLLVDDEAVGALTFYAAEPGAFSRDDEVIAGVFATRAAIALHGAVQHERPRRTRADLNRPLRDDGAASGIRRAPDRRSASVRLRPGSGSHPSTVELSGDIDAMAAPEVWKRLLTLPTETDVVVDLSGVGFLGSAGLTVLIELRQLLADAGAVLYLTGAPPVIRRVMALVGLRDAFPPPPSLGLTVHPEPKKIIAGLRAAFPAARRSRDAGAPAPKPHRPRWRQLVGREERGAQR